MAHGYSFICSVCHERIEDCATPVVVYVVASLAPMHPLALTGSADIADIPLPKQVREIIGKQRQRRDFCAGCFALTFNLPLVDAEDNEVATPAQAKGRLDGVRVRPAIASDR